jgi:predicted short-subunit dehydrogenase-like oxidoreductase (DUF2520 family)
MIEIVSPVHVIGMGRAGRTLAARLAQRGVAVTTVRAPDPAARLVLLCVPDGAIAEVAASIPRGPWIAHVSGATPLAALAPHARRFGLHPLVAFDPERGPEQLDGTWAAIAGESSEALEAAGHLAAALGLHAFEIAEANRSLYHAAAVIASNYLVALERSSARLFELAGAPPEALLPLMRGTVEAGFPLTGPIARGDWETVAAHLDALAEHAADLLPLYRALGAVVAGLAGRSMPTWAGARPE